MAKLRTLYAGNCRKTRKNTIKKPIWTRIGVHVNDTTMVKLYTSTTAIVKTTMEKTYFPFHDSMTLFVFNQLYFLISHLSWHVLFFDIFKNNFDLQTKLTMKNDNNLTSTHSFNYIMILHHLWALFYVHLVFSRLNIGASIKRFTFNKIE